MPSGERITVGPEERAYFKARRIEKGLGQTELGRKVGTSQGTISNLENGRHVQIESSVYAALVQVLGRLETSANAQETIREIHQELVGVGESDLPTIRDMIRLLKAKRS